jgi:hypothetical protein
MSDITFLELVPIVLSIFLFRHYLANQWIVFSPQIMVSSTISNKSSKSSGCKIINLNTERISILASNAF